jgi:phosphatidylglycerol:prolipoprotein diacylglycerol transferase
MGIGWGIAYQLFFAKVDIPTKFAQILFWGIFISAWIGSKVFFYLTTENLDQSLLTEASFWTGGGLVFYGGLIFAALFIGLYKLLKLPITQFSLWCMLPALTAGHAIGRIGCLLAGCCFGKETDLWWGIELHGAHRHPTQALESFGLILLTLFFLKAKPSIKNFSLYFIGYGVIRFGIELLRGDQIRGLWGVFTPSQWASIILILVGMILIIVNKSRYLKPVKEF